MTKKAIRIILIASVLILTPVIFTSCDDGSCFEQEFNKSQQIKAAPGTPISYPIESDC
ncbi:MAG: hypothetical protein HUK18_05390 [Bacteroidales bacterium]|nr:hypothetical protein [Bacteroidales bacterium]